MNKQLQFFLKSASLYTLLNFLPAGLGLFITPLLTNHLQSTEEYGFIILANFFFTFFGVLIGLGFDSAYGIKFFHYNKSHEKQNQLLMTVLFFVTVVFSVLLLLLYFFGDSLFDAFLSNNRFTFKKFGLYTVLMGLVTTLNALLLSYYRNTENLKLYSLQAIGLAVVATTSQVVALFFFANTAESVVQARSLGSLAVIVPFAGWFAWRHFSQIRISFLPPLLKLSVPFFFYGVIIFLFENVDRLLVEKNFSGMHELSIYGLAITFASIAEMVRASLSAALSPMIFRIMSEDNNQEKINRLYRLFIWIVLLLMSGLLLVVQPVFALFIKNPDFFESLQFIPLLFLALIPKIYYSIYQLPLSYHSEVRWLPVINLFSLGVGMALFFWLLPYLQVYSIIVSLLVSRSLQAVLTLLYLKRYEKIYRKEEVNFSREQLLLVLSFLFIGAGGLLYIAGFIPFWIIGFLTTCALLVAGWFCFPVYVKKALVFLHWA